MKRFLSTLGFFLLNAGTLFAEEKKIEVFPAAGYDQWTIYINLILFWFGIVGLVIVLVLKLKEIERTQKIEKPTRPEDIPFLE